MWQLKYFVVDRVACPDLFRRYLVNHLPKTIILCGLFILLIFGTIFTLSILTACPVDREECNNQRKPVAFPHDMHMGWYDCLDCHHIYDKEHNNILDPMDLYANNPHVKCASCHDSESKIKLQEAFHLQCIGCHFNTGRIDRPGGPNLCGQCHKNNKGSSDLVMILGESHD